MSVCMGARSRLTRMQTASAITNLFVFLVLHPEYQRLVQKELDELVVTGSTIPFSEIQKLPYLNAVWKESLRTATVPLGECPSTIFEKPRPSSCDWESRMLRQRTMFGTVFSFPRDVLSSAILGLWFPFSIPSVLIFVGSIIMRDPRIWRDDRNQFKPERFLTPDAKDLPDPTSTVFGFGRRFVS